MLDLWLLSVIIIKEASKMGLDLHVDASRANIATAWREHHPILD